MRKISWHILFVIALKDFFTGSVYEVHDEKDLSVKQQKLDVLIIEKKNGAKLDYIPDGLENLCAHNLMTYKSHQQSLDSWTLDELIGHYVNYRKQASPSLDELLPVEDFQLYAVSTRYPRKLLEDADFKDAGEGLMDVKWGSRWIRLIVLSRIPPKEENAIWQLFSAKPENVKYGADHYRWRTAVSAVIDALFKKYKLEGVAMSYSIEDFQRDYLLDNLHKLSPEDLIERLTPEDRLKGLGPDDRLKGLAPDDLLKGLTPDDLLRRLTPEDRLKGLAPEDRLKGLIPDDLMERLKSTKSWNRQEIEFFFKSFKDLMENKKPS